jgi:hypothetical protein
MQVDVTVKEGTGVELNDATVRLAIAQDGRELWAERTSGEGSVQLGSSYGFGSGRRLLTVDKDQYKRFSAALDPRSAYAREIVPRAETDSELSGGTCVEK